MKNARQLQFDKPGFRKQKSDHGGSLRNPQKRKRPLGVRSSLHLVLRSTKARGQWSFLRHKSEIEQLLEKFSKKYHVKLNSFANAGNHLHLHIKVPSRKHYRAFIRALSSAIMMKVTGYSRWKRTPEGFQFWDQRPFSRIISTWSEFLNLGKYVQLNRWEGAGVGRQTARKLVKHGWLAPAGP